MRWTSSYYISGFCQPHTSYKGNTQSCPLCTCLDRDQLPMGPCNIVVVLTAVPLQAMHTHHVVRTLLGMHSALCMPKRELGCEKIAIDHKPPNGLLFVKRHWHIESVESEILVRPCAKLMLATLGLSCCDVLCESEKPSDKPGALSPRPPLWSVPTKQLQCCIHSAHCC